MSAMKSSVLVAVLLLGAIAPAAAVQVAAGGPVEKVVTLLKEMQERIGGDAKAEKQRYNKYACWCETMTKKKAGAINEAREQLRSLGQEILKRKAEVATLSAEIEQLIADIKDNEESQAQATAIRQKENAAFMAESAETKQAIAALEKAITVLGKATSFVQTTARAEAVRNIQAAWAVLPYRVVAGMSASKMALVQKFTTGAASQASYSPQSESIQGILQEMYSTMSSDLESSSRAEAASNRNFEDLIETKQKALELMQESMKEKEAKKAEAETALAEATELYDEVETQMKADIEFFDATKESCEAKGEEWKDREALREEELEGIAKALEILTSDDARALFDKAINPANLGFLQVEAVSSAPEQRAYTILKAHASKSHSLRLARLAAEVRTAKAGHFDEVIKSINEMIQTLQEEQADDIKKRDQCKEEFHKIASVTADLEWKIEVNQATIAKLEDLINKKDAEKVKTIEEIEDVKKQILDMEDQRKEENEAFLQAKKDDEAAIELLEKAKKVLTSYHSGLSLVQRAGEPVFEVSEEQAPEAEFSSGDNMKYESKGIGKLLEVIIEDLDTEIANGIKDEAKSQLAFEKSLGAAKQLKKDLIEKKETLTEQIAKHGEDKDDENSLMRDNNADLTDELDYKKSILNDCNFAIDTFDKRASARTVEMDALTQAKEFLVGYTPEESLVQSQKRLRKPSHA